MTLPPDPPQHAAVPSAVPPAAGGAPEWAVLDRGAELMLAWQGGDEQAFHELVDVYSGQVYALLTRFLGRGHPGREDLVQEVFLRVVKARARYTATARFSTWLYTIVWRICINETERSRSRRHLSLDAGLDDEGGLELPDSAELDPAEGVARADVIREVRAAIAELPDSQRIAMVLARYHSLSFAEIADVVGSSEKAIKSMIHRARESLRARLQPLFEREAI
ncbi:sigma-70 family RNA polymerase sigma factor [bacterium]|nr:sigma-70 family RNA polymerase sigma factor [bacterium]